jgi:hypothetical protein
MTLTTSPRVLKGGIAVVDPERGDVQRLIPLQYNPETLTRSFQVKEVGEEADRAEALRLTGPPVETITLEAVLDATDALERGEAPETESGIAVHLAVLELLISPSSAELLANEALASAGRLEILPMTRPLSLFIWSRNRVLPVKITELSVTEEAFDPDLNPIRARLSLTLRVLTVDDLGFVQKGGSLFLNHLINKEQLAGTFKPAGLATFGLGELP